MLDDIKNILIFIGTITLVTAGIVYGLNILYNILEMIK